MRAFAATIRVLLPQSITNRKKATETIEHLLHPRNEEGVAAWTYVRRDGRMLKPEAIMVPESARRYMVIPGEEIDRPTPREPAYCHLTVEAALCAWEAMLEQREENYDLRDAWERVGTVTMRHAAIEVGKLGMAMWDTLTVDEQEVCAPYDWEFFPALVSNLEWDRTNGSFRAPDNLRDLVVIPRVTANRIRMGGAAA